MHVTEWLGCLRLRCSSRHTQHTQRRVPVSQEACEMLQVVPPGAFAFADSGEKVDAEQAASRARAIAALDGLERFLTKLALTPGAAPTDAGAATSLQQAHRAAPGMRPGPPYVRWLTLRLLARTPQRATPRWHRRRSPPQRRRRCWRLLWPAGRSQRCWHWRRCCCRPWRSRPLPGVLRRPLRLHRPGCSLSGAEAPCA